VESKKIKCESAFVPRCSTAFEQGENSSIDLNSLKESGKSENASSSQIQITKFDYLVNLFQKNRKQRVVKVEDMEKRK